MFSRPTVFVVGAGASYELGFPLGDDLKENISSSLNILFENGHHQSSGDIQIAEILRRIAAEQGSANWTHLLTKAWQIRDALPGALSIDNVLDAHNSDPDLVLCGKLAICKSILTAERSSKLFGERELHRSTIFQKIAGSYLIPLFQMFTENVPKEAVSDNLHSVSTISFNYDRSIERFLPEALSTYYGFELDEAASLAHSLEIIHPYGTVGDLEFGGDAHVPFGAEQVDLRASASRIRTFTEGIADRRLQADLYSAYYGAETVVFLGFAFHPLNLRLLSSNASSDARQIVGTTYGLADAAKSVAEDLILQSLSKSEFSPLLHSEFDRDTVDRIDLENETAVNLLQAYFRAIV